MGDDPMESDGPTPEVAAVESAARVVLAYVLKNHASPAEMLALLRTVHAALLALEAGRHHSRKRTELKRIQESITPDALISFFDGKPYKSLKRHLASLGFDPKSYRERYALPDEYPMVAPRYAARRSQIARASGLGHRKTGDTKSRS
jgi:predicted transcriptional regulator